jgi:hypothetical protein
MEHSRVPSGQRRGMAPGFDALTTRLDTINGDRLVTEERMEQPDGRC